MSHRGQEASASPAAGSQTQPAGGQAGAGEVSVIVCTHSMRRCDLLAEAITSLESQTLAPAEIIIVVDHNLELLEWATARWPHLRVVENAQERGLSGARNTGLGIARATFVGFLDDDARASRDWVEGMCAAFADPLVIGVGGTVDPDWETRRPRWFPREFDWVVGCTYRGMPVSAAPVRNVIGASMSFRRSVVVEAGAFRSELGRIGSLPVGCEETELCIRAGRAHPDAHVLFEPRIRVEHRVTRERAMVRYFLSRCYSEGRSKAAVARLAGARQALSTERRYVSRTLPSGIVRGLRDCVTPGVRGGAGRAAAIVAGLVATTVGYGAARMSGARPSRS